MITHLIDMRIKIILDLNVNNVISHGYLMGGSGC